MMHIENGLSNGNFHLLQRSNENSPGASLSPRIDEKTEEEQQSENIKNIESLKSINTTLEATAASTLENNNHENSTINGAGGNDEKTSMQTPLENNKNCEITTENLCKKDTHQISSNNPKVEEEDEKESDAKIEVEEITENTRITERREEINSESKTSEIEESAAAVVALNVNQKAGEGKECSTAEVVPEDLPPPPQQQEQQQQIVDEPEAKIKEIVKSSEQEEEKEEQISPVVECKKIEEAPSTTTGNKHKSEGQLRTKSIDEEEEEAVGTEHYTFEIQETEIPEVTSTPNNTNRQNIGDRIEISDEPVTSPKQRPRKPLPGLKKFTPPQSTSATAEQQQQQEQQRSQDLTEDSVHEISAADNVAFEVLDRIRYLKRNSGNSGEIMFLVNVVKKIFGADTDNTQASTENPRKRRVAAISPDLQGNPVEFKYRRVDNSFPDHYATPSTSFSENAFPAVHSSNKFLNQRHLLMQRENMENRRPMANMHEPIHGNRRSMLSTQTNSVNQLSNYYAGVNLLHCIDDYPTLQQRPMANHNTGAVPRSKPADPVIRNIPIRQEYQIHSQPQSNPYLENGFDSSLYRKPTYAEAVRLQMPQNIQYGMGSNFRNLADEPSTSRQQPTAVMSTPIWRSYAENNTRRPSVLNREREIHEMKSYQELLAKQAPNIYNLNKQRLGKSLRKGINSSQKLISGLTTKLFPQSRRSLQMVKAAQEQNPNTKNNSSPLNDKFSSTAIRHYYPEPTLATTINLDDEIDENDNDIEFVNEAKLDDLDLQFTKLERSKNGKSEALDKNSIATIVLQDNDDLDDDVYEIIDLASDDSSDEKKSENRKPKLDLPYVEPVNIWAEKFKNESEHWLDGYASRWHQEKELFREKLVQAKGLATDCTSKNFNDYKKNQHLLMEYKIPDLKLLSIDEFAVPEPEPEPALPELTDDHQARIKSAVYGPPDQVLISKFNMSITRRDIQTLVGHTWLNDEVINFYMNLLIERGELKSRTHGYPKVHAMNTFFIPKLMQSGHAGVRRWTRKIDIFDKDVIPVPVHVGGVHWCMAIIHLKNRTIKYYDSMGTPNPAVLQALEAYLQDESMDKKQKPFDTSDFHIESVQDVPQQMNGSDCGVFSCMFAEFITRNREITFTQEHMQYFRQKMIYEIVTGELMM